MDKLSYQVPFHIRLQRLVLRPLFRMLTRLSCRLHILGRENIPPNGAYLIAINHVSFFEPPLVLSFWPAVAEAAGAVDLWDRPGINLIARMYGGIQVHRGEFDRVLIETLLNVLKSGKPLLIAPEGTRSHTKGMGRAQPGVAYLADQAQVAVLPVGITGTSDDLIKRALRGERPVLEMRIGQPVWLPPITGRGEERRKSRQANADAIMQNIAELLPAEYHGFYAENNAVSKASNQTSEILDQ